MSVNKFIGIGRLGKDPETRYMQNGEAVTNASIAMSEKWKDKSGQVQEKTEWVNLVFYRKLAEIAGEYLRKGAQIYVEGKLQTRKWQDKDGSDRYTTEIVVSNMTMLGGKSEGSQDSAPQQQASAPSAPPARKPAPAPSSFDNFDDDIPFIDPYKFDWRSV